MHWFYLTLAIVAEVTGTSALKLSDGMTRPLPSLVVVLTYALAFWCLAQVLKTVPVGLAYAIWAGAGTALIAVVGWLAFGQRLDAWALAGIGCIVVGVVLINGFSRAL